MHVVRDDLQACIPLKTWIVFRVVSQTTQQFGHS